MTEYFYDNAGNRFIKKGPEATTLYLRHAQIAVAMDIEIPMEQAECVGKINRYVMSGDLLAGRITTTVQSDGAREVSLYYYHLDHLNSTKIVSDEEGAVDVRYVYRAFGEQLAKIGEGDARYTYGGKELDDETNLYYFNARYYDAVIGRFISEDPAQDGTNWYVYADNNPLKLVDPTGLSSKYNYDLNSVNSRNKWITEINGGYGRPGGSTLTIAEWVVENNEIISVENHKISVSDKMAHDYNKLQTAKSIVKGGLASILVAAAIPESIPALTAKTIEGLCFMGVGIIDTLNNKSISSGGTIEITKTKITQNTPLGENLTFNYNFSYSSKDGTSNWGYEHGWSQEEPSQYRPFCYTEVWLFLPTLFD